MFELLATQKNIVISEYSLSLTILLALLLDFLLGEPKRFHHLIGFGVLANKLEKISNSERLNTDNNNECKSSNTFSFNAFNKIKGALAWCVLVIPLPILYSFYCTNLGGYWQILLDGFILYLAIALTSLKQHAMQVYRPINAGQLAQARHFTAYLVSRNTETLSPNEMSRAVVESVLENGHDAVIASLIYYLIGGIPLVIAHRLANTLDAMWGYKNSRYSTFGFAAAKLDDILGFISGKCTTLLYAIQQPFIQSLKNAYRQGNQYKSHNGGWVMAAGATVINRQLGGSAQYHGKTLHSVSLGQGKNITAEDIPSSVNVVTIAAISLLVFTVMINTISWLLA